MCLVIGALQSLGGEVRVHLSRHEMRVAQEFLHASQIGSRIEQMRGVAVPEFVRRQMRVQSGRRQMPLQPLLQNRTASIRPGRSPTKKPANFRTAAAKAVAPVIFNRLQRRLADGHQPLLLALPAHTHYPLVPGSGCPPHSNRNSSLMRRPQE